MTKVYIRGGAALTGAVIALAWAATGALASGAKDNWKEMEKCAAIADADARHECTDDVLHKAGLLVLAPAPSVTDSAKAPEAQAPKVTPAPQAVSVVPAPKAPASPARPASAPPPKPKLKSAKERYHADVTLATAVKRGDGKLMLTTTDGVAWQQLYLDVTLPMPKAGQSMRVWEGKFGGYMCRIEKFQTFRCTPAS